LLILVGRASALRSHMEARKKALLRRKGYGTATAHAAQPKHEDPADDDIFDAVSGSLAHEGHKTWTQKRVEHLKSRANGGREAPVLESEVSLTALSFAAKLKARQAAALAKLSPEERLRREASALGLELPPAPAPADEEAKSWAQRRKENLMARAGARPPVKEPEVTLQVVSFAAKLKRLSASSRDSRATEGEASPAKPAEAEKAETAEAKPKEKTWAQKRKENYLARHGQRKEVKEPEVTVAAVSFAAKLKAKRASSMRDSMRASAGESSAASEQV